MTLCVWNICECVNYPTFLSLPFDVKTNIFDWLPRQAMLQSVMTLDHDTYHNYYLSKYTLIRKLKRFLSAVHCNNLLDEEMHSFTKKKISNLIAKVMMDEVFELQWMHLFDEICSHHPRPMDSPIICHILRAMGIVQISFHQLMVMNVSNVTIPILSAHDTSMMNTLKVLILSSRALSPLPSISEDQTAIISIPMYVHGTLLRSRRCYVQYPWINVDAMNLFKTKKPTVSFFIFF